MLAPPGPETAALLSQGSALLTAQRESVLDTRLAGSGLPVALQESVRAMLPADWTVAKLDGLIEAQRTAWAALEAERTVQGHDTPRDGRMTGMVTGLDQLTEALAALMDGVRPRNARPLSGLREAYLLLIGRLRDDREVSSGPRDAGGGGFDHDGQHRGRPAEQAGRERVPEATRAGGSRSAGRRTSAPCRRSSGSPWAGSARCPPWPKARPTPS